MNFFLMPDADGKVLLNAHFLDSKYKALKRMIILLLSFISCKVQDFLVN